MARRDRISRWGRNLGVMGLGGVLAACGASPSAPEASTPAPAALAPQVPDEAYVPALGGGGGGMAAGIAPGITPLAVEPADSASLSFPAGPGLTAAVSALGGATGYPGLRLEVSGATAPGTGYRLRSAPGQAPVAFPFAPTRAWTPPVRRRGLQQAAAPSAPAARTVGAAETFWVVPGNHALDQARQQTAVLQRISPHAYFYLDQEAAPVAAAEWDALVEAFETRIYPRVTAVFGEPARPGVDGEDRVFLVFSPAVGDWGQDTSIRGYFSAEDALPAELAPANSNRKEVLFLDRGIFTDPAVQRYGAVAHEFQHLINFSRKAPRTGFRVRERVWLDEALSMYAMDAAGYGLAAGDKAVAWDVRSFQMAPEAYSLTDWSTDPNGYAYGMAYLFARYLVDRHGEGVLREVVDTDATGMAALDAVIAKRDAAGLAGFFRDWTVANLVSGRPGTEGTPYRYASLDVRGTYGEVTLPGISPLPAPRERFEAPLRPWGATYFSWQGGTGADWQLRLSSLDRTPLAGALVGAE